MTVRRHRSVLAFATCLAIIAALGVVTVSAQVSVWTHHNDNSRTGANLAETELNRTSVNSSRFGKLFSYDVDGFIFAQPLYIPGVQIPGKGTHNVVYVVTANDSVYAFDADSNAGANAAPLWHVNYTNPPGIVPVPTSNIPVDGTLGIMGTPVIDQQTGTMYFVARTKEGTNYFQRLHALDIGSGAEKFGGPVNIVADVSGNGEESVNGRVPFNPKQENQRPGLALSNGLIYVAWAAWGDIDPWHGWVMAFDKSTLQLTSVFNATPDGGRGGFWMSGQPPAIDGSGNLFLPTGNGDYNGTRNFGQSVLKLSPTLSLLDWFTPDNYVQLNVVDLDISVSGSLLVPNTSIVVQGGKSGQVWVMRQNNMGRLQNGNGQIVQTLTINSGHLHGSPIYWNSPTRGPLIYLWAETDFLKAFHFNGTSFDSTPLMKSTFAASEGMPGAMLSVSSNGATPGTGILWASMPLLGDALMSVVPGVLRAFDADNLSTELWNSEIVGSRDSVGAFAKFGPPTIANGKVYLTTFSNRLNVYGLFPSPDPPTNLVAGASGSAVTLAWTPPVGGTPTVGYNVYRGFTTGFVPSPANQIAQTTTPTYTDSGLSQGTYFYRVLAVDAAAHVSNPSNEASATIGQAAAGDPTIDQFVTSHGLGTRTTPQFSTTSPNELLVAFVATDGPTPGTQTTTVSGAGLTWRLVVRINSQPGSSEIWAATANTVLTNVSVTSTQASGGFYQSLNVLTFTNAATGAAATAAALTGAPTVSVNATQARSLVYAVGNDWDRALARTMATGQTKIDEYLPAVGDTFWLQRRSAPTTGPGAVVMTVAAPTTDRWNFAAVEVAPSGPPPLPAISNVTVTNVTASSVRVNWTTNIPATSQVDYGPNTGYGQSVSDTTLVTTHQMTVSGLQPETTYHYRPVSRDSAGNVVNGIDSTFTTAALSQITVAMTEPVAGGVSGTVRVSANAQSTGTVTALQFLLDGNPLGSEIAGVGPSFSMMWDSNTVANGQHTLSATARDATANSATATGVIVTVTNVVNVPNVVGQTKTAATSTLGALGLVLGSVTPQPSTTVPIDVVINQNPAPPATAVRGDAVNVTVSSGVIVPNLFDQPESAVPGLLSPVNLVKGSVTTQPSSTIVLGNVISQTPAAGASASGGSAVNLVVSSGLPPPPPAGPVVDKIVPVDGVGARTTAPFSTSAPNELLVAFVASDGPGSAAQTMTVSGAGLTWTLVRRVNTRAGTSEIWTAKATSQLTNVTVTSTPARTGFQQALTVIAFVGASGVGASGGANALNGAPSVSLVTTKAGSVVYGVGNDWDNAISRTVGPNQVMVRESVNTGVGDTFWLQARTGSIATVGTTVVLNDTAPTADRWNFASVEIVP